MLFNPFLRAPKPVLNGGAILATSKMAASRYIRFCHNFITKSHHTPPILTYTVLTPILGLILQANSGDRLSTLFNTVKNNLYPSFHRKHDRKSKLQYVSSIGLPRSSIQLAGKRIAGDNKASFRGGAAFNDNHVQSVPLTKVEWLRHLRRRVQLEIATLACRVSTAPVISSILLVWSLVVQ